MQGATTHVDSAVRKVCIQVFERLAAEWVGPQQQEEAIPGFREYIMKQVNISCLLPACVPACLLPACLNQPWVSLLL